jgi:hypothetical protein
LLPVLATPSEISIQLYRVDDLAPASLGFSRLVDPKTVAPPLLVEPDAPSFHVGLVNDTDQVPPVSPVIGTGPCLDLAMASDMNVTVNGTSLLSVDQILFNDKFKVKPHCFKVYSRRKVVLPDPIPAKYSGLSSPLQLIRHSVVKPVERILFPAPQSSRRRK